MLRACGHAILEADNGQRGLKLARQWQPDLVLCDLVMNELDGYGVLQELRSHPSCCATPVIVMTEAAGWQDMRRSLEQGADDFLLKPFSPETLQVAVQARLNRRQKIEEQLEMERPQKTAFFEALVNSSPDGILVFNQKGEKVVQNEQFNRLLKIPRHLIGLSDDTEQFQYVKDSTRYPDQFHNTVRHLNAHPNETNRVEIEFKDGRILERNSAPVLDHAGEIHGRIWTFRDITNRKHSEAKLHVQTSALAAAANGIVITDPTGVILWVNPAFTRLTGYSTQEAVGKTPAFLNSGKHDRIFYKKLWDTIQRGEVWQGEVINRRKDGSHYYEEMTITPVLDENGGILNFVAIKQEITVRKRGEAELRAREEAFRALADNVPDAVTRIDRDLRIVYGNRTFAHGIGLKPTVFLGKSGGELNLNGNELWVKKLLQVFQTGKALGFEFHWPGPEDDCHRETRLVPECSPTGEVEFVLAITRDVSEQRRGEKERQLMELHLRQSQKMEAIGQLAAGIAHEINTPTQYVGDNTRFLKDAFNEIVSLLHSHSDVLTAAKQNALTPEILKQAEDILMASDLDYLFLQIPQAITETLEGVERVTKIVRAMKDFSHPGGKEKTAADLNKAIESTTTVARNEWKYVADLKLELAPGLPFVPCFLGEFNQAILNLVINAAHAIGETVKQRPGTKGQITLQTRQAGDQVEVRVSDTGPGIAEMHRPRIFEPFFTTKEVGKGTGQGLTLVYNTIVKQHGGTATFETEMGKGTTFVIRLPLYPKNPASAKDDIAKSLSTP